MLLLKRVTVWDNHADGDNGSNYGGGGIFNRTGSNLNVTFSTVAFNTSNKGAAGIESNGSGSITDSMIVENTLTASVDGVGGIGNSRENASVILISNSVVANNTLEGGESSDIANIVTSANVVTQSIVSNGFNFISDTENFVTISSDIQDQDSGLSNFTLENNLVEFDIAADSQTLHSGSTFNATELEGVVPHIGGYSLSAETGMVFWVSDTGDIYRSDASFRYSQLIVPQSSNVIDLEVDRAGSRVYWLDKDDNTIWSARFDGTAQKEVLQVPAGTVDFELELQNQRIFLSTATNGASQIQQYFIGDDDSVVSMDSIYSSDGLITTVELDQTNSVLYWSEIASSGEASIASLETRHVASIATEPDQQTVFYDEQLVSDPYAIAIVSSTDQLFWTEPEQTQLSRLDTTGSADTISTTTGSIGPLALTYDSLNDRLLFSVEAENSVAWTTTELAAPVFFQDEPTDEDPLPASAIRMVFSELQTDSDGAVLSVGPSYSLAPLLNVSEGGTLILDNSELNVTDPDTADARVTFTVRDITAGVIEVSGNVQSTFTLADLKDPGAVQFQHLGDEPVSDAYIDLSVTDGETSIDIDRIVITVDEVNDETPVAPNYTASGPHRQDISTLTGGFESLLEDVTDADVPANTLTVHLVNEPSAAGEVVINPDGKFVYTPPANIFTGEDFSDQFTYVVRDGENESEPATVTVQIEALPGPLVNAMVASTLPDLTATELEAFTTTLPESLFSGDENTRPFEWDVSQAGTDVMGDALPPWLRFEVRQSDTQWYARR